ncbi:MAG: tetratricopeptide repeat protein [Verrucomicrobiota bacterium]
MTPSTRPPIYRPILCWLGLGVFLLGPFPANAQQAQVAKPVVEDVLSYADLLYSRKQYALAANQYSVFIRENPNSQNIQIAWFRLGECYLEVKQVDDAIETFNYLIKQYKRGPFVGSAAYRLAVLRFNARDYQNALAYFKIAKDELSNNDAKLQAQFYYARSLQLTQKPKEALAQFEQILASRKPEDNPFHERCLLESARLAFELGDTPKALEQFKSLAEKATTQAIKEEAIVRGGLLAAEAGEIEASEELLDQALRFSDTSPWKNLAQVGAIFNAFTREDYDRVIGLYNTGAYAAPDESRAKMLLIVGHSFRIKGDLDSAARLYSLVEGKYPNKKEGIEAGYRRLQILHQKADPLLPEVATRFADRQRAIDPESFYIDMAWLMKAEWHFLQAENSASGPGSEFAKKHFGDAAAAYKRVRVDKIDEKYRETALYKQGWAEIESDNLQDGILSLSRFISRHPKSPFASSALAKRAVAYQTQGDHQFALGDYQSISSRYPDAPEVEFALQQIALIYAHQRKTKEMITAYETLLEKFPKTNGAGEAYYWIGVGHFDLEEHEKAVPNLEKGRDMDPNLEDQATLRLVICHYQLENIAKLATEAKRYLEGEPEEEADDSPKKRAKIPPPVLEYLGKKLAASGSYKDAEYFLTIISNPDDPAKTAASTWKLIAEARQKLKKHVEAITAFDNFLLQTERPSERANAYLARGISQFCLRDFENARNSAQESLRSQKEGRTNAEARLLLGDIGATEGNLEEAAREYLVVSQIFSDPEVTPKALAKAINAYQSLGNRERAQELQNQLSAQFPNYKVPESFDFDC